MKACWAALVLAWGVTGGAGAAHMPGEETAVAGYTVTGRVDFDDPEDPALSGRVVLQEAGLMTPLAATERGGITLAAGAWAGWTRLDFQGHPELDAEDLYGLGVLAAAGHPAAEGGWGWSVLAMPGFTSDFRSGRTGEGKVLLHAAAEYAFSGAWKVQAGLAYDTAFGDPAVYPAGGVVWRAGESLSVNLLLPSPSVVWTPSERWGIFVFAQPAGDRWRVEDDEAGEQVFLMESWRAGAGAEWRVWGPAWLRVAGGMDLARRYEVRSGGRTVLDEEVEDTWFASAALAVY
ncbi:MAG: hypothetical protein GX548_08140 [Lentisphaerae bacterium]|nr:hypothetical protein [Lentisphaerota bacterium]